MNLRKKGRFLACRRCAHGGGEKKNATCCRHPPLARGARASCGHSRPSLPTFVSPPDTVSGRAATRDTMAGARCLQGRALGTRRRAARPDFFVVCGAAPCTSPPCPCTQRPQQSQGTGFQRRRVFFSRDGAKGKGKKKKRSEKFLRIPTLCSFRGERRPSPVPHTLNRPHTMSALADAAALEAALAAADAAVTRQGDAVRALKAAAKEGTASKVRERMWWDVSHGCARCVHGGWCGKGRERLGEGDRGRGGLDFQSPIGGCRRVQLPPSFLAPRQLGPGLCAVRVRRRPAHMAAKQSSVFQPFSPHTLPQDDVDAAIKKLQELKLEREEKVKVRVLDWAAGKGREKRERRGALHSPSPQPLPSHQALQAATGGSAADKEAFRQSVVRFFFWFWVGRARQKR